MSTCSSGFSGLRAAGIAGLRQFLTGKVNDVIFGFWQRCIGLNTGELSRKDDYGYEEERFENPACHHSFSREHAHGSFPGKPFGGPAQRGTDGRDELLPGRRPLHEQLRSITEVDGDFLDLQWRFAQD